jgi:hypothetical protein
MACCRRIPLIPGLPHGIACRGFETTRSVASNPQAGEEKKKKHQFSYASYRWSSILDCQKASFFKHPDVIASSL